MFKIFTPKPMPSKKVVRVSVQNIRYAHSTVCLTYWFYSEIPINCSEKLLLILHYTSNSFAFIAEITAIFIRFVVEKLNWNRRTKQTRKFKSKIHLKTTTNVSWNIKHSCKSSTVNLIWISSVNWLEPFPDACVFFLSIRIFNWPTP